MTDDTIIVEAVRLLETQRNQIFPYSNFAQYAQQPNRSLLASILEVTPSMLKRIEERGWLTVDEADRMACRIGTHPSCIWPEWSAITPIPEFLLELADEFMSSRKKCVSCKEWKETTDFFKRSKASDGLNRKCAKCALEYERARKESSVKRKA